MDKIKEVVAKITHPKDSTSATHGTHTTGTGTTGTHGTTNYDNPRSANDGPHSSSLLNKLDPRVDSDRDGSGIGTGNTSIAQHGAVGHQTTTGSTNAGPHSSNLANAADPRVDSDRDGSNVIGSGTPYGAGTHNTSTGVHGTTGGLGSATHTTAGSTNAGPHDSNILNKLDPRVDSDRDGSHNMGANQYGSGTTGTTGLGSGTHGTTGLGSTTYGTTGSTNAGPHDSNIMNAMDPRVDSDRDGSRNMDASYGSGTHNTSTGTYGATGLGSGTGTGTHGTTGSTNAGPHNSNILNVLDPRVDSDRDGSRTVGNTTGNQQY